MTSLLLGLLLCWDANIENDLLGYWVESAERHVVDWVECPCPQGTPCLITYCPVYSPFSWQVTFTGWTPRFERNDCANAPHSVCYYRHPVAEDLGGRLSEQPDLLWPPPFQGGCP